MTKKEKQAETFALGDAVTWEDMPGTVTGINMFGSPDNLQVSGRGPGGSFLVQVKKSEVKRVKTP